MCSWAEEEGYALLLGGDASLCEVVLEVLDAAQGHHAFAFCSAAAKGLEGPVRVVHVWVVCNLTAPPGAGR